MAMSARFFGAEVTVQLTAREDVELLEDQPAGLFLGELATNSGEDGVGLGETGFEGGLVLVEGSDLLLVILACAIEVRQLGVHLPDDVFNKRYIIAREDFYFVYPTKYEEYKREFMG
jgi:hypothetical protein